MTEKFTKPTFEDFTRDDLEMVQQNILKAQAAIDGSLHEQYTASGKVNILYLQEIAAEYLRETDKFISNYI